MNTPQPEVSAFLAESTYDYHPSDFQREGQWFEELRKSLTTALGGSETVGTEHLELSRRGDALVATVFGRTENVTIKIEDNAVISLFEKNNGVSQFRPVRPEDTEDVAHGLVHLFKYRPKGRCCNLIK